MTSIFKAYSRDYPIPKPDRAKTPKPEKVKKPRPPISEETKAKIKESKRAKLLAGPLTYLQCKVLAAIMQYPGLRVYNYANIAFGYSTTYTRKRVENALKGLLLRGLIRHYAACHCGEELCKKGHSYKCKACGSIYADVYVTFDKIGLVE